jgi:hypothetical protein
VLLRVWGIRCSRHRTRFIGVDVLQDPDLKFTVTGGVVDDCVPLALVEGEMSAED